MRPRTWATGVVLTVAIAAPTLGAEASAGGEVGLAVSQIGTYAYLSSPDYRGLAPLRRIVGPDSIGLGTFNDIDGEMITVSGTVYRVGTDGKPKVVPLRRTTPFAQTVTFRPDVTRTLPRGTSCADLTTVIDRVVSSTQGIVAVRIRGRFSQLQTRSVPRQSRPYPALEDVIDQQTMFDLDGRRATLVGFRTGPDLAGASAVGTHLHGLTRDRTAGGHVLSCTTGRGVTLRAQLTSGLEIRS